MMKISLSEYIRKILRESFYLKPLGKKLTVKSARLSLIAENAVDLGKPDLARNFDEYFEASLK